MPWQINVTRPCPGGLLFVCSAQAVKFYRASLLFASLAQVQAFSELIFAFACARDSCVLVHFDALACMPQYEPRARVRLVGYMLHVDAMDHDAVPLRRISVRRRNIPDGTVRLLPTLQLRAEFRARRQLAGFLLRGCARAARC